MIEESGRATNSDNEHCRKGLQKSDSQIGTESSAKACQRATAEKPMMRLRYVARWADAMRIREGVSQTIGVSK